MNFVALAFTLIAGTVSAGTDGYALKINLSLNGQHIASPRLLVKAGEKATISQKVGSQESFIEVIATENESRNNPGIRMKFIIGYIQKNGERTVIAQPQIIAHENSPAGLTQGKAGQEQLSLTVEAERKSL